MLVLSIPFITAKFLWPHSASICHAIWFECIALALYFSNYPFPILCLCLFRSLSRWCISFAIYRFGFSVRFGPVCPGLYLCAIVWTQYVVACYACIMSFKFNVRLPIWKCRPMICRNNYNIDFITVMLFNQRIDKSNPKSRHTTKHYFPLENYYCSIEWNGYQFGKIICNRKELLIICVMI